MKKVFFLLKISFQLAILIQSSYMGRIERLFNSFTNHKYLTKIEIY